ncbi:phospholipase C [Staphylococcus agnetis]|uniref:sphingomyelin phosphodiesterase n=1 Tax=Staphylococcus agnetis TaxID=985762 RepID=UPI000E06E8A2|nr:sphingomyelin phosphodiesterase [Staphylococcus agnetis]SUK04842.1 phospholipase C [Staphylococcus agnetis]
MKLFFRCLMVVCLLISIPFSMAQAETEQHNLKITTHNVYFMPRALYPNWGQMNRADLIAQAPYMQHNDVVILNELFDEKASAKLKAILQHTYPYQSPILGESSSEWDDAHGYIHNAKITNGGVAILSRYPIMHQEQHIFAQGRGSDAMAKKGFVYIKVNKNGHPYHIIGTHLQADNSESTYTKDATVRASQMVEIRQFIQQKHIPKDEMIVIGGDMNVKKGSNEYNDMLAEMNVSEPQFSGHTSTWDTETNSIAKYNYPDLKPQYLDYLLVEKDHAQPQKWTNRALNIKSPEWSVTSWGKTYHYQDYSDHYPVVASQSQ